MVNQSLCIHGHFYQPPREDPTTGNISPESGAEPYHNWNERIHSECYHPNARLGNFERISFNVGPTLFEWMVKRHPNTCSLIVQQDQANVRRYGFGNALAQPYHHTILPLATRRDKETQVYWGIQQFKRRFGRSPEGMWLPETAVDLETLEILAELGIKFTILAPWQVQPAHPDCTEPYQVELPHGKSVSVFLYHEELSGGISFAPQWTTNADQFIQEQVLPRLNVEKSRRSEPQIMLIASDGELYGHHQPFRDYFLAHLVNGACLHHGMERTNLAYWINEHPPRQSITIQENTSWSCHHGVLRWKGPCGCSGAEATWKIYLRQACDRLAHDLDEIYVDALKPIHLDPWQLRNQYIDVLLGDQRPENLVESVAGKAIPSEQLHQVVQLLESQHLRQRMFASCAWFFDDFARLEPRRCLAFAAKAAVLAQDAVGVDLADPMKEMLKKVRSQGTGLRGDEVFSRQLAYVRQE